MPRFLNMFQAVIALWLLLACCLPVAAQTAASCLPGDIIFQTEPSRQSQAVQLATGSRYSHCGIIFEKQGQLYVVEAIGRVSWTPLDAWIKRGIDQHYVVMRLKDRDALLDGPALQNMQQQAVRFTGKPYDIYFKWSDEQIYCSELVWKIYERGAGLKLVMPRPFSSYSLNHGEVQKIIMERFGVEFPLDELAVSPGDLMDSPLLQTVTD